MSSTPSDLPEVPSSADEFDDREEVVDDLRELMRFALYKSSGEGRLRDESKEQIRISYLNAFANLAGEFRRIVNDMKDDEIDARLERIEHALESVDD